MNSRRISRRSFVRGALAGAAAIPLAARFPYFARAGADGGAAPVRLVLFPSLNGAQHFFPNPGNLDAMSVVTEPLAAYRSQLQFIRGVGISGSQNHFAVRAMFTGAPINDYGSADPTVASVDQAVAAHIAATAPTPMRSLHLGAIPADAFEFYQLYGRSTFFFTPSGPLDYEANPVTAWDQLSAMLPDDSGGEPPPPPDAGAREDALHDAALGIAEAELAALGQRVAGLPIEASKVERHAAALGGLRRGGDGSTPIPVAPVSCDSAAPASVEALRSALGGNARAAYEHQHYSAIIDAQIDVMARALACGLTRVATLQCGSADGNVTIPIEGGLPHHNTSHGDQMQFSRCQAWYAGKFARLLQALDITDPLCPEGNTVLHNSVVVWMSECMPSSHAATEVPCMYAGSAGGRLTTGGFVNADGASNLHFMRTLTRALGAPDANSAHFGGAAISELLS